MKLFYSATSPFARKVVVAAAEKGIGDRLTMASTGPESGLARANPLSKVPTLVMDDGTSLFDSAVICEYLDSQAKGRRLIPARGPKRFGVLRIEALADGLMDAAVLVMGERKQRPPEKQHQPAVDKQMQKIDAALDAFEAMIEAKQLGRVPTVGSIAVACALGYLEFRFPELKWRKGRPRLGRWYKSFAKRPSMMGSVPKDPV